MWTAVKPLRCFVFALSLICLAADSGCHAQVPAKADGQNGTALSPEMARRIEVLIRSRSDVTPDYTIKVGPRTRSDIPGYDTVMVEFLAPGKAAQPATFLLSADGKTLAQFKKYDISKDPKEVVSAADRPARGGPADAPVLIVGFDDLECPYCSRMNAQLFPAVLDRYKDKVRIVYRDLPLDQHPWAMRAAIDANCVGSQSSAGYWNLVDYIHVHANEFGGEQHLLKMANETLDTLAKDEAKKQKIDEAKVDACIVKQDDTAMKQSKKEAEALGVDSTPALFINGQKIEGAQPIEYIYKVIDGALVAAGQTPPPPVPLKPQTDPSQRQPEPAHAQPGTSKVAAPSKPGN